MHDMRDSENRFEQFFKSSYSLFYFTAYHLLGDEEKSRDVVNDCFALTWSGSRDGTVTEWRAYMYNAVRNKCIDMLRRDKVRQRYVALYQAVTPEAVDEQDDDRELLEQIYKKIESLPELPRKVLHKCYFEGKKYKETAAELGISESYVKKNMMIALKNLRSKVVKK